MKSFFSALCAVVLVGVLAAPNALAQRNCDSDTNAPPGNSEVDQYSETVPGPCGDRPVGSGGGSGDPSALPPGTASELEALGEDGRIAAALAQSGAPGRGGASGGGSQGEQGGADADEGGSLLGGLFGALLGGGEGDSGMGVLLPLILLSALVLAVIYGLRRRLAE